MEFEEGLRGKILRTINVDPNTINHDQVRQKLADLEEEIVDMIFGHLGHERITEDVVITCAEINSLVRVREVNGMFMEAYETFIDKNF